MPAAENIVTRYNGFTAGCSFHNVKTAEAAFKMFSFIPKILFTAVLLMQNCKRTENRIKSVKPIFTVRPSLKPTLSFPPCLGHCPKNPQDDSTAEDILKPVRLLRCKKRILQVVSCTPDNLCKFAEGKLGWAVIQLCLSV